MTPAQLDALRAEVDATYGPPRAGPPPAPGVAQLGVGWSVYETAPADSDYWPRGGVVVDSWSAADDDGEVYEVYLLVKSHQGQLRFVSLRGDQLSAESVKRPNRLVVGDVCRTAARSLGDRQAHGWRKDLSDLELWSLGVRLTRAIT